MGYYTNYDLHVKPVKKEDVSDIFDELYRRDLFNYVFDKDFMYDDHTCALYFNAWGEQKWYEHDEDMEEISRQFPNCVFKLECNGEDGDRWIVFYQNGKHELCQGKIVYEEPKEISWPQ